jgi:hypothetical protein
MWPGGEEREVRPGALPHRQGGHRARADRAREFRADALKENLLALMADLQKIKPATSKGVYLKKVTLSSTMGPGVAVDQASWDLYRLRVEASAHSH